MLFHYSRLVLQLPQQHVDEVRVLDDNRNFLKHVLIAHTGLLQAVETHAHYLTSFYTILTLVIKHNA